MSERPKLSNELTSEVFLSYYYLKDELVEYCRKMGLPVSGGKNEITDRIAKYLDTGVIKNVVSVKRKVPQIKTISRESLVEANFVCSELHREFFKDNIGKSFSFNVTFQNWLKSNTGRTYSEAIEAYYRIMEEKKTGRTKIDKQFEYNAYIRDFFEYNKGKSLEDAIKCWRYKKQLPGHNKYENSDLKALEN